MLTYHDDIAGITAEQLSGFFEGWRAPLSPEQHLDILKKSDLVVLAVDPENSHVVGFVTALTDHVQAAFIPLLEVLPAYRNRGVGTELMRRMLAKLAHLPSIDLTCDPDTQAFYAKLGMQPSVGMILRQ